MKSCFLAFIISLILILTSLFAQESDKLLVLSKQIIEAKDCSLLKANLEETKGFYLKENKFNEFADFLASVLKQKKECPAQINYYIALTRYQQLKYLEESQGWDEYFQKGNDYRAQITQAAQSALETSGPDDILSPSTRLLLWQFHRGQQDTFSEQALNELLDSLNAYSKNAKDGQIIKEAADIVSSYGEKGKAKEIYRLYVSKITSSQMTGDELSNAAAGFLKENNSELAENIYDIYIERIVKNLPKEKSLPLLISLAKVFAFKDEGTKDMFYAEKVFAKIEEVGGNNALDEELSYLRALNLEKSKEYRQAGDLYLVFSQKYPESIHNNQALFKLAVIEAYILGNIKMGSDYFVKLAEEEKLSAQSISALYQLGLLSQWEGDLQKAGAYYNKLIEKAGVNFSETVISAKDRLKEIESSAGLENNLKLFLDLTFKENSQTDTEEVNLSASTYLLKKDAYVTVSSNASMGSTGCMQVDLQYFWSGDLGSAKPQTNLGSFSTSYKESGTKIIFLAACASASPFSRSLDMLDVD